MPAPANPDVAWAIEDIRATLPAKERALRYYRGDHPLTFATTKFRNTFGELFQELADNLCDDVVNEPTDRLQIENWGGPQRAKAQEWWDAQRGSARSGSIHQNGFRAGDAYAIVWDNGDDQPRLYVQDPRQMAVRYSQAEPDQVDVAAKCWREGKGYRLNLYYADRVEHYYSKGWSNSSGEKGIPNATAFQALTRGTAGDDDFVDWLEPHDKGRIPVFHFPNGDLGGYGLSVLHDVYPLQDALNKTLCDFLVAMEDTSLPKRWATGIQVLTDPVTGQEMSPFKDGQNLWWTRSKEADLGQFPSAEMSGFLAAMDSLTLKVARKGALPPHSVNLWQGGGNAPSGLSLLISEGKLVKRVKDRQRDWGVVWRELVAFALSWSGGPVEASGLDIVWGPIETRDERALLETLALKKSTLSGVVPDAQLAREAGYSDEELEDFMDEKEEETARKLDAAQAAMGGRISPAGPPSPAMLPTAPTPPNGARQPVPSGA